MNATIIKDMAGDIIVLNSSFTIQGYEEHRGSMGLSKVYLLDMPHDNGQTPFTYICVKGLGNFTSEDSHYVFREIIWACLQSGQKTIDLKKEWNIYKKELEAGSENK